MPATPADIAKYTNDGIVISQQDFTIRDNFPDALDSGDTIQEMFFDSVADAQEMLDERFALLSVVAPPHEGIEVTESLGLGQAIPIAPYVPCFRCIDAEQGIDEVLRTTSYAYDMGTDRFSVEVRR